MAGRKFDEVDLQSWLVSKTTQQQQQDFSGSRGASSWRRSKRRYWWDEDGMRQSVGARKKQPVAQGSSKATGEDVTDLGWTLDVGRWTLDEHGCR